MCDAGTGVNLLFVYKTRVVERRATGYLTFTQLDNSPRAGGCRRILHSVCTSDLSVVGLGCLRGGRLVALPLLDAFLQLRRCGETMELECHLKKPKSLQ